MSLAEAEVGVHLNATDYFDATLQVDAGELPGFISHNMYGESCTGYCTLLNPSETEKKIDMILGK